MNKQLNTALAVLFLATASIAADEKDSKYYVGIGGTTGTGTFAATAAVSNFTATAHVDYDSSSVPVKLGMYLENGNRLELSYQSSDLSDADLQTETVSGINIDYKMFLEEPKIGSFVPYGVAGIGMYEWENTAQFFADNENLKGIQWGVGAGGVYKIDNSLELEATAQYKELTWQDVRVGSVNITSDNSGTELYLGLNYKLWFLKLNSDKLNPASAGFFYA